MIIVPTLSYAPVMAAMRRAAGQMGNTRPLMRSIAGIQMRAVEDNFAQEGRPKWKDLHPGTKLGRSKQGTWPGMILQRSAGGLAASITSRSDDRSAITGTNKVYAAIHQFGGKTKPHVIRPKAKRALSFGGIVVRQVNHPGSDIPARPFLSLTPRDLRDIVLESQRFYNQALARNGLMTQR
jgi:phage virion morphogenesis protein